MYMWFSISFSSKDVNLFSELSNLEAEVVGLKQELEVTESKKSAHSKAIDKSNKLLKQEKDEMQKVTLI